MDQLHCMQQRVEMVRVGLHYHHHRPSGRARKRQWRSWNSAKNPKHNGALGTKMAECSAPSEAHTPRLSLLMVCVFEWSRQAPLFYYTRPALRLLHFTLLLWRVNAIRAGACIYLLRLNGSFSERDDFTTQFGCQKQILTWRFLQQGAG